jgi:hypothetical protein
VRLEIIALGLVLAVVGAVLWLVPLAPANATIEIPVGDAYDFGIPGALEVGSIPYTLSWTSHVLTNVTIYLCGSTNACPAGTNGSVLVRQFGTYATLSWESHAGQYYLLVPNQTVNVTVDYKEPLSGGLVGLGVLGTGLVIMLAGLAIPRRPTPKPAEGPAPAAPAAPAAPPKPPKWSEDDESTRP